MNAHTYIHAHTHTHTHADSQTHVNFRLSCFLFKEVLKPSQTEGVSKMLWCLVLKVV